MKTILLGAEFMFLPRSMSQMLYVVPEVLAVFHSYAWYVYALANDSQFLCDSVPPPLALGHSTLEARAQPALSLLSDKSPVIHYSVLKHAPLRNPRISLGVPGRATSACGKSLDLNCL